MNSKSIRKWRTSPVIGTATTPLRSPLWETRLYSDERHSWSQAIDAIRRATGKSEGESLMIAWDAHHGPYGVVVSGVDRAEALRVAMCLRDDGLLAEAVALTG